MLVRARHAVERGVALAALLVALVAPATARAAVVPMDLDDLARAADSIVVVDVAGVRSRSANASASKPEIVTDHELRVTRVLKGSRADALTLTQPGGTLNGVGLMVTELPVLVPGERCVLFLNASDGVVGGWQGRLTVERGRVVELDMTVSELARRIDAAEEGFVGGALTGGLAGLTGALAEGDISVQAVPVITGVSPAAANAGVGEPVTIAGSGFGPSQGTGIVEFRAGDYSGTVTAAVTSWSDTAITVVVPRLAHQWVRVITSGGDVSAIFAYQTGFSTGGRHVEFPPLVYEINENTADMSGEGAQVQAAFATWNAAGSQFRLSYGGSTTASAVNGSQNFHNEICFASGFPDNGILGWNRYWYYTSEPEHIIESDIVFNDYHTWAADSYYSGGVTRWDVQTIALHELGHTVGLDDQYGEYTEVMGAGVAGMNKRTLTAAEIAGALYLYGPDGTSPLAPAVSSSTHPSQDLWDSSTTATFSFSASGATGYSYVLDASPSTTPDTVSEGSGTSASYGSLAQGERYFHVRAVGSGGAWGPASHYRIRVDTVAPSGTVTIGDAGSSYVTAASVPIVCSVTDGTSGLSQMRTFNGTVWSTWVPYVASTSVTLPAEGTRTPVIEIRDAAGNVFSASRQLTYDATPPTTTSDAQDNYTLSAVLSLDADDAVSGVDVTYWGVDEAPVTVYDGPITVEALGDHELRFYSVDHAGNAEDVRIAAFTVNEEPVVAEVERLYGRDRYATAVAIAEHTYPGYAGVTDIVVACGEDRAMADPLSAAGLAGVYDAPIITVYSVLRNGKLPSVTEDAITTIRDANGGRVNIHVIGGTAVVPDNVYARLDALNGTGTIERVFGRDRYLTAVAVAEAIVREIGIDNVPGVLIADGRDSAAFYDALAIAPSSAAEARPLLLVMPTSVPAGTRDVLQTTFAGKERHVVNSSKWVSSSVVTAVGASGRIATSGDRVLAAVEIAEFAIGRGWLDRSGICVANTLADALPGGGAMGYLRTPILYTSASALPSATCDFITAAVGDVERVYALGGTVVISEGVYADICGLVQ